MSVLVSSETGLISLLGVVVLDVGVTLHHFKVDRQIGMKFGTIVLLVNVHR